MTGEEYFNDTNHVLIWDSRTDLPEEGLGQSARLDIFGNLLAASRLWSLETRHLLTRNLLTGSETAGRLEGDDVFVYGFAVFAGGPDAAATDTIDLSFLRNFSLSPEAKEHVETFTTLTFVPISGFDATMVLLWARDTGGTRPNMPVEVMIGLIHAFNVWLRPLKDSGVLLDTGRIYVRHLAEHLYGGTLATGRKTSGRLIALGSYPKDKGNIQDAAQAIGLNGDRYVVEAAQNNGWWSAWSDAPAYYDNPRDAIIV